VRRRAASIEAKRSQVESVCSVHAVEIESNASVSFRWDLDGVGSQRIMHSSARVPIAHVVHKPAVIDGASVLLALVAVSAGLAYGHHARVRSVREDLPRERIVYSTRRPANWQLYLFGAGPSPKQITDDPALNYDATFSPDGRWVVFCSERSGNPHLYAIGLTHPGLPRQLTHGAFMDATPAFTPDGKSLLFVSDRERSADIFTMPFRPDDPMAGDKAKNLTHNPAGDFRPAVSPDGKTVAFSSDRDNGQTYPYQAEIYVMNVDGSNLRRLTTSSAMSGSPAWSRDGRTLFFYSDREGGSFRIWAMDADGAHQRPLTPKELSAFSPAVVPNGRIAFATRKPDGFQIMSVAGDGSDVRLESGTQPDCRGPAFDHQNGRMVCTGKGSVAASGPSFVAPGTHNEVRLPDRTVDVQGVYALFCSISPDGLEVVTGQSLTTGESKDILVVNQLDGSKVREVFGPSKGAPIWATSWARRADLIAFTVGPQFASDDAVVDIWTVHSDGSGATNLTKGKFRNNAFPDLTADGSEIVFRSTRDGNKQIYLMNSDGTNVRRITTDPANAVDTMPSISPNGDMIAFSSNYQIYIQRLKNERPDGSPRLFQSYRPSMHSRFSPDGKWVVFASRRGWLNDEAPLSNGNAQPYGEIFVAPVDGKSEPIRLTHNKWEDSVPCWGVMPHP
jgi:TolB protein